MNGQFEFGVLRTVGDRLLMTIGELDTLKPWLALLGGRGIGWATDEVPVILSPGHLARRVGALPAGRVTPPL